MNIGNVTSDNFNLDYNGKEIQREVYEQLIEQLQQENKKQKEVIDKAIKFVESEYNTFPSAKEWRNALLRILNEVSE